MKETFDTRVVGADIGGLAAVPILVKDIGIK